MLRAGRSRDRGSIPGRENRFIFQNVQRCSENQPASYLRIKLGILPRRGGGGGARPGHEAVHLPHLVPSWRMSGAIPPLPYTLSVCDKGQYYLIINYACKKITSVHH